MRFVFHVRLRNCFNACVEKVILFPLNCLGISLENSFIIYICICFWTLSSISLYCLYNLMPIPCSYDYCSFITSLKKKVSFPNLFLFKTKLGILGSLNFHIRISIYNNLSISTKMLSYIFIRISLSICINLGIIGILIILSIWTWCFASFI